MRLFGSGRKVVSDPAPESYQEMVREVFGFDALACFDDVDSLKETKPLLALEGLLTHICSLSFSGVLCGNKYPESVQGMGFEYFPAVESVSIEGIPLCVLTLRSPSFVSSGVYAFTRKPFKKPVDSSWVERKHHRSCRVWENTAGWSLLQREQVEKVIDWVESCGLTSLCSNRYAIFFHDGYIRIVFAGTLRGTFRNQLELLSLFFSRARF